MKKYIKIVQKEYGENASDRLDSNQFKAASEISQRSSRLYEKYSYYLNESNKKGMSDALSGYVDSYAADVVNDCRSILGMKAIDFIRYY
jgi:LPS O-antigen subunit length determinant protein (WzzB/FepE family)